MSRNKYLSGNLFAKRKRALVPSETSVSGAISDYLDRLRIFHLRLNSGKARGLSGGGIIHLCPTGTPDRFCIYRGLPVFIEVKKPGEKPTDEQLDVHRRILEAGGVVIVAEDVTDVINGLKKLEAELNEPESQPKISV